MRHDAPRAIVARSSTLLKRDAQTYIAKSIILSILILCFIAGCGNGTSGTNVTVSDIGNVEGIVSDLTSSLPISGVAVQIGDKIDTSDNNGVYSIQDLVVGNRTITATKAGYQNFTGSVTVQKGLTVQNNIIMTSNVSGTTPALVSLAVAPANPIITAGTTTRFTATGMYSDNTASDLSASVVWASSNHSIAIIDAGGVATAVSAGTSTISAALGNITGSTILTVTQAPPIAPIGISAKAGDTQSILTWNVVAGATSYTIYWATVSGVNKINGSLIQNISQTTYIHNGLSNGTTYYYVVTATNANGESIESSQVFAAPTSGLPFTLALGLNQPYWVTVDNTQAYWTEPSGSVKKVGLLGGTVTTLASGLSSPIGLVVDASNVYWAETTGNAIRKVSINGGSVTTLATVTSPGFIAMDANYIYFATQASPGLIGKIDKNGGSVITLVSEAQHKVGIAVDANNVYWADWSSNGSIKKIDKNGGAVTVLASSLNYPWGIAVDGTNVYWSEEGTVRSIKKVSITGGSVTTLANGLGTPAAVVADSNYVYWTDASAPGNINQISTNGGTIVILASGLNNPIGIAIGTGYVYWAEEMDGSIKRITSKKWMTKSSMTVARQQFGTAVINGQLYVLGGVISGPGTVLDSVERYDPTTGAWTVLKSMPHLRYRFYSAAVNGKIYVFGGSGWTSGTGVDVSTVVDVYDPLADSWQTLAKPMPRGRNDLFGAVVNGKIYLIGGQPTLTIDEYDSITDSWVTKSASGAGRQSFTVSVSGTNMYIIGGWSDSLGAVLGKIDRYDPINDVITEVSTLPIPVQGATSSSLNGLIYVFGGSTSGGNNVIAASYRYNPTTNEWRQGTSMATARYKAGSAAIGTLIYVVGGEEAVGQSENSSRLEAYDPVNDFQ